MNKLCQVALCCAVLFFLLLPATAGAATVVASDSGFITESGATDKFDGLISPASGNYSVGYEVACVDGGLCPGTFVPMQRKNYFTFDLSGISDPIVGVTLKLFNPVGGYESTDLTETYVVGATDPGMVPGALGTLAAIGAVSSTTEVDDGCADPMSPGPGDDPIVCEAALLFELLADSLGDVGPGPVDLLDPGIMPLGTAVLTAASDGMVVDIIFTPFGVAYVDAFAGGTLLLAGALASSDPPAPLPQSVFGFSSSATTPAPELEIITATAVVPLPAGLPLLLSALGLLGFRLRSATHG